MRNTERTRGLSLIEVLVALSIMALALLALLPMFSIGVKTNSSSNQVGMANTLAGEKIEELTAYPSTDPRLAIPNGNLMAGSAAECAKATVSCSVNTACENDLPLWYNPTNGKISYAATMPTAGAGWYPYPLIRTYTVQAYVTTNAAAMTAIASAAGDESVYNIDNPTPYYGVKLVTVTVQPSSPSTILPGLRRTVQSGYVRFRNVLN